MGWFEDLAKGARYSTLGKLARAAVAHEDWPSDESRNERSVENMLRLVDQRKRKGQVWLDNRPEVKEVLAILLNVSPEGLDPGLVEADGPADPRVELKELREARPIDLRRDDLYPGIPAEVLNPSAWGRTWWLAYAGAGKTLVGRWLEARRLAVYLRGERLADVIPLIPATGAVYVELTTPDSTDATRWAAELDGRGVCVAAPFVPVPMDEVVGVAQQRQEWEEMSEDERDEDAEPALPSGWEWVKTPPKEDWIDDLVHWVAARMRAGGGFDAAAVLKFVKAGGWDAILATPGDYIGICGVVEALGVDGLEDAVAEQVAVRFLDSRVTRPDLGAPTSWRSKDLFRLISGCVEGAMIHSGTEDTFTSEQALKRWLNPDALPPGDDSALLKLADVASPSLEDLEAAKRRARPSIDGAVRELFRLHLLEPIGEGAVALRPTWLALVAAQPAMQRLIDEPQRGLGKLLLRPKAAKWPLKTLRDSLIPDEEEDHAAAAVGGSASGWRVAELAVELLDYAAPESVALLEATFQAVGIALLDPEVPTAPGVLHRLWESQMRLSVDRYNNSAPQPRIFAVDREAGGWENGWYIACLSISERLHLAGIELPAGPLSPWAAATLPEFAEHAVWAFDRACTTAGRTSRRGENEADPPDFLMDAWRLAGRVYRKFGVPSNAHSGRTIYAPFLLFDAIRAGQTPVWDGRIDQPYLLDALETLARDEGLDMPVVLEHLWRAKAAHGGPTFGPGTELSEEWTKRVWSQLPPEVLREHRLSWLPHYAGLPWDALTAEHWEIILDWWGGEGAHHEKRGIEHVPEAQARRVARERLGGGFHPEVYEVLWSRFPTMCVEEAVADLVAPAPAGSPDAVLWRTPDARVGDVVAAARVRLAEIVNAPAARLQLVRWAHLQCSRRGPHWLTAWNLLTEVAPPSLTRGISP